MMPIVRESLTGLGRTLADLKDRVRLAVAGELGRAVSRAVQQVVQALVAGQDDRPSPTPSPWDDDDDEDRDYPTPPPVTPTIVVRSDLSTAVTAGVQAARWWMARQGTLVMAAGVGLGVGLIGVLGGPIARTLVAMTAVTADILRATEALTLGSTRLSSF